MIRKNIFMMLIYYILLIHFLQSLFACVIIESKEGIALYAEIELDKKERMCVEIPQEYQTREGILEYHYRDWETDRKSTRLNSSHSAKSRMPSSA